MVDRGKKQVRRDMLDDWAGSIRASLAPLLERERVEGEKLDGDALPEAGPSKT
jgi:hypothetical protein